MGIFDKLKNYVNQLNEFEYNISENRKELQEVYERNRILEKEIVTRTQQLDQANKALLTLRHILDMMNSSTPLSNVLDKIVESLTGEFDYLFGAIAEKVDSETGGEFVVGSYTKCSFMEAVNSYVGLNEEDENIRFPSNEGSLLLKALKTGDVLSTKDVYRALKAVVAQDDEETSKQLEQLVVDNKVKSLIVLPLKPEDHDFGCMLVFSPRAEILDDELGFLKLFAQQMEMAVTIANLFERVQKEAITDPLTELFNRRYFNEALQREAERSERLKQPFTLISLDLDHLKQINDTYGHNFGDIAIKTIGKVLKRNARSIDIPARIGGEEFNVMLPGIDSKGGMIAAERIRAAIEAEHIEKIGNITASIGVSTYFEHTKSIDELLEIADQAMYKAKIGGRNRVVLAKENDKNNWQQSAIDAFMDILSKNLIPVDKELAKEICAKLERVDTSGATIKEILYSVSDMIAQTYDPIHAEGLTKQKIALAVRLVKRMDMSREVQDNLKLAMLLYDIGNTMIPDEIFKNPKPLNEEEKDFIHKHPIIAAKEILAPISSVADIIPIIEKHHENWDGSGYPGQLKGEEIPISSQVVLLIDSYTALLQQRSYRPALSQSAALEVIKSESGKKWNKELVDEFIEMIKNELE